MQDDAILYAGPFRCRPGGLSVTRTFGDIEAKREDLGGKPGVVIPDPEISTRIIDCDDDFVIMGSDGIFDA
jgi:protein phosphatase 2C family protein 2/3